MKFKKKLKSPSFTNLKPASEISSHSKRANRCSDTEHELILRKEIWSLGLRYRKNVSSLPGKPDIVFSVEKVAVFCDGEFWHGRNWERLRSKLNQGTNAEYWLAKIESNIKRDKHTTAELEQAGWHVIRLWETDIKKNTIAAAKLIKEVVCARRGSDDQLDRYKK